MMYTEVSQSKKVQYWGSGWKRRQDETILEEICDLVQHKGKFHELVPDKLYLVNLVNGENADEFYLNAVDKVDCPFIMATSNLLPRLLIYDAFSQDFGPLNLSMTHTYCSQLKVWLDSLPYRPQKALLVVLDELDPKKRLNFTLLTCIAAMVLCDVTDEEVIRRLEHYIYYRGDGETPKRPENIVRGCRNYTDVSGGPTTMNLKLNDCIKGFYSAMRHNFYDYYTFDQAEYLCYESVVSGDINWVIPGKLLAFAGPADQNNRRRPQFYYKYFKDNNVTTIVRLNDPEYDKASFTDKGFEHYDILFPDGYPPKLGQAKEFIDIVDKAKGAVAVHCYAGIGRTGTLIAAYLLTRYHFTAQMATAWTRICRPGSVISGQQDWLLRFGRYSERTMRANGIVEKDGVATKFDGTPSWPVKASPVPKDKTGYDVAERSMGQARALVMTKRQRGDNSSRPCTRNSTQLSKSSDAAQQSTPPPIPATTTTCSSTTTKKDVDLCDIAAKALVARKKGGAGRKDANPDVLIDLGRTIPWTVALGDFKDLRPGENPPFYTVQDDDYSWRVRFPPSGYVPLKPAPNYLEDQLCDEDAPEPDVEHTWAEFKLDFVLPSGQQPRMHDHLDKGELSSAREGRYKIIY